MNAEQLKKRLQRLIDGSTQKTVTHSKRSLGSEPTPINWGEGAQITSLTPVSGGDCHAAFKLEISNNGEVSPFFVKASEADRAKVLASEYESLTLMRQKLGVLFYQLYPNLIAFEHSHSLSLLILDWIEIEGLGSRTGAQFARDLASHHACTQDKFGWPVDNYCGLTPQPNKENASWAAFFVEQRLRHQLRIASKAGLPSNLVEKVEYTCVKAFELLKNHHPVPALLHGDLWGGNAGYDRQSQRSIFYDPAPYFGDAEVDIAMTQLFGGFPREFYTQWDQMTRDLSLTQGEELDPDKVNKRRRVYNLYHALNHFNLFGGGYIRMVGDHLLD